MDERYEEAIIEKFPYPIAKQFIKLRTEECMDPGPQRLKALLATGEALSRFLGVVVLSELRELLESRQVAPSPAFGRFAEQLARPSWGFWQQTAREGLKLLATADSAPIVRELEGYWFDGAASDAKQTAATRALDDLITLRNGLSHDRIKAMLPHEFARLCGQAGPLLEAALAPLEFLLAYRLAYCGAIEVSKRRRQEPRFIHRYKRIAGTSDDFRGGKDDLEFALDSPAILLVRDADRRNLNLDPLFVYEPEAGAAPDIFFFNGTAGGGGEYAGCGPGGRFESDRSRRAAEIGEEVRHLLGLFGAGRREAAHG